jgi:hypothetical protein
VNERSCQFGEKLHLAGIVTEPDASRGAPRGALVLVSAGLVPKFGPFRLYVELARRLAQEGIVTLRFDLGGVGDSQQAYAGLPLKERTPRDVSAAVDWLSAHIDVGSVVLGGLCSGGEDSFRSAEHDPRVSGVVMIDPFAYRTRGFMPRHLLHRAVRRTRRALGLYRPIAPPRIVGNDGSRERVVNYEYMAREESSRILGTLLGRRAHAHFIYTGGASEVFNHRGQLHAMFGGIPFDGLVTVDHFPELEHTQMLAADRLCLVEAVVSRLKWLGRESSPMLRTLSDLRRHG